MDLLAINSFWDLLPATALLKGELEARWFCMTVQPSLAILVVELRARENEVAVSGQLGPV